MYRILHNQQTSSYRIEKRGFFGWNFVLEQGSGDYLQFEDLASARRWVAAAIESRRKPDRRWNVVSECHA